MRSRGSLELRRLGTGKEIAELLKKTPGYISKLLSGRADPAQKLREEIFAHGGPEPIAWDEPLASSEIRIPDAYDEDLEEPTADEVRSLAASLMKTAKELEKEIALETSAYERVRYVEKLSSIAVDLGKLTGATIVNERMLLNSPGFKRVLAFILKALEPWPDAMWAVAQALKEFE